MGKMTVYHGSYTTKVVPAVSYTHLQEGNRENHTLRQTGKCGYYPAEGLSGMGQYSGKGRNGGNKVPDKMVG